MDENTFKVGDQFVGILVQLVARKNYGFISASMGVVFLPPREYVKHGKKIVIGSSITFTLARNSKGYVASSCTINEDLIEDSSNSSKLFNEDFNDEELALRPPYFSAPSPPVDTAHGTSHIGDSSGFNFKVGGYIRSTHNDVLGVYNKAVKLVSSILKTDSHDDEREYDKKLQNLPCPSICSSDSSADESNGTLLLDKSQAYADNGTHRAVDPATYFLMPAEISSEDIDAFATFSRQYQSLRDSPMASVATELTNTFIQQEQKNTFPTDLMSNTRKGDAVFAEQIIQNYRNAFAVLIERYRNGLRCITKDFMKDLHADVCRGMCTTAGKFRSKPVRVGTQRFVKVALIDTAVDDFCTVISDPSSALDIAGQQPLLSSSSSNKSLFAAAHPCVKAAYVAYRFCYIHPFEDGNGRTARLLANFILTTSEVPFPISFCSSPMDRKKYIAAFRSDSPALLVSHFMDCTLRVWRKFFLQFTDKVLEMTLKSPPSIIPSSSCVESLSSGSQKPAKESADHSSMKNDVAEKADSESHLILYKARALLRLENCVICFEKDSDLSLLCCGMPFHAHCIFQWMAVSQNRVEDGGAHCPQCRHTIDMQGLSIYTSATKQDSSEDDDDYEEEEEEEEDSETSEDSSEDNSNTTTSDNENESEEGTPICRRCNNIRSRDCINRCCGRCCGDSYLDLPCLKHSR